MFRTTSDEYFARPDPLGATDGRPFDLAFIDGLHLFEYSLRDFIHAEQHSRYGSVIVFDDVLPRSRDDAARERHTRASGPATSSRSAPCWPATARTSAVVTVDTVPTGLMLVMGLDPDNTALTENYAQILADSGQPTRRWCRRRSSGASTSSIRARCWTAHLFPALRDARASAAGGELEPAAAHRPRGGVRRIRGRGPGRPAPAIPAEVAAALKTAEFAADATWITESADGARLSLPVLGVLLDHVIAGNSSSGQLAVPARLICGRPGRGHPGLAQRAAGRIPARDPVQPA